MSSKLLFVKADICFSAARALSFFDVDFDLIFSPKSECLGVTPPAEEAAPATAAAAAASPAIPSAAAPFPSTGVTFGVEGMIDEEGWTLGEGGVC